MTCSVRTIVACSLALSSLTAAAFAKHEGPAVRRPRPAAQQVTFNRDIAPLLSQYCDPCHRPAAAGPFPLLTYADANPRGGTGHSIERPSERYLDQRRSEK